MTWLESVNENNGWNCVTMAASVTMAGMSVSNMLVDSNFVYFPAYIFVRTKLLEISSSLK